METETESNIIEPYRRMMVLEGEVESLKETLRSYMSMFNDFHKRIAAIEKEQYNKRY